MIDAQLILAQRYEPASFEGIPFDVVNSRRSGSNNTTTVRVQGRGARQKITSGGEPTTWAITGWLRRDEGPWADQTVLDNALHLSHDHDAAGTYIDPWDGPQRVVPLEWSFERESDDLTAIQLSITFKEAVLSVVASTPGFLADSPELFYEAITSQAAALASEPAAAAQLESQRATLNIPSFVQGEDYATTAASRLVTDAPAATAGVPLILQQLGAAARTAAAGEYTREAWGALRDRMIAEAARSNSPTILAMRETLSLYMSSLGADAFGRAASKPGRALITIATGRPWPEVVKRNRDAVLAWLVRDRVAL